MRTDGATTKEAITEAVQAIAAFDKKLGLAVRYGSSEGHLYPTPLIFQVAKDDLYYVVALRYADDHEEPHSLVAYHKDLGWMYGKPDILWVFDKTEQAAWVLEAIKEILNPTEVDWRILQGMAHGLTYTAAVLNVTDWKIE